MSANFLKHARNTNGPKLTRLTPISRNTESGAAVGEALLTLGTMTRTRSSFGKGSSDFMAFEPGQIQQLAANLRSRRSVLGGAGAGLMTAFGGGLLGARAQSPAAGTPARAASSERRPTGGGSAPKREHDIPGRAGGRRGAVAGAFDAVRPYRGGEKSRENGASHVSARSG